MIIGGQRLWLDVGKPSAKGRDRSASRPRPHMSTHATDDSTDAADDAQRRYAELTIDDDEFVIYDRENYQAWVQSTSAVDVGSMR